MPATLTRQVALTARPTIVELPCGVTVVAEQMPLDAVSLNVWVDVGSIAETDDINGMAHFLEHMVFKGTERLGLGEFERYVEACGGNTNAATSQDYTHYFITVAPQDFARLAPLQLDVVLHASIPEAEFQRERLVVLEEIRRSEDNPGRRVYRHTAEMAFERLPYRRPVLGPAEVVAGLSCEQMRTFHRTWYRPQNMTVAVVGNLPPEEMVEVVASVFAGKPREDIPPRPSWQAEAPFDRVVRQEIRDPGLQQARLVMMWRVPGVVGHDTLPLNVLASILSSGRTSRLVKDLREDRRLVDKISASNMTFLWQGTFQISAQLAAEHIPEVEAIVLEHVQRLRETLVTAEELEKICNQVASRFVFANESPRDRSGLYGYYHRIVKDLDYALTYPESVKAVSREALRDAAIEHLSTDAYAIASFLPE